MNFDTLANLKEFCLASRVSYRIFVGGGDTRHTWTKGWV